MHECGIGIFVWSTVMAYNGDKLKDGPQTWADFWDTKKFPGKRGLRKGARYNLEFALMADGVKPADVYKVLATQGRRRPRVQEARPSSSPASSGGRPARSRRSSWWPATWS